MWLFVDMLNKEMKFCRQLGNRKGTCKWSFSKWTEEASIFLCVNLDFPGDTAEIINHSTLSKKQFEEEAPLSEEIAYSVLRVLN